MELQRKFPALAGLGREEDVDAAILKSKKVMEESRAVTSNNPKRNFGFCEEEFEDSRVESLKFCEKKKLCAEGQNFGISPGVMFQEIQSLNLKLAGQLAYIKSLENKVAELKVENEKLCEKNEKIKVKHREELLCMNQMYEERMRRSLNVDGLEGRMKELEEKIKMQGSQFLWMEEKVQSFGKGGKSEKKIEKVSVNSGVKSVKSLKGKKKPRSESESRVLVFGKKKEGVKERQKRNCK